MTTSPDPDLEPDDTYDDAYDDEPNPPYDLPVGVNNWTEWCT